MSKKSPIDELPEHYRTRARNNIAAAACDGWVSDEKLAAEATWQWIQSGGPQKAAHVRQRIHDRLEAMGLLNVEYGEEHSKICNEEFQRAFPRKNWPQ